MEIPKLFLERMRESLGSGYGAFAESLQKDEVKALRLNVLKNVRSLPKELEISWHFEKVPWEERGFYYQADENAVPPGKHPLHEAGAYYIQEPSAMYPVALLKPGKNEKVLDLCAAPGGKSTQIASYMENTGLLVCNEPVSLRARILSSNIERMGVQNALVTNMEPVELSSAFPAFFDRVLVDAPCSGEGMMRRGDAARENWSMENVSMCAKRQADILDEAAKCVRPGGRMVYSTCTFSAEEDEDNVKAFIYRHPDFEIIKTEKLFPHIIRGEGHFAALLERRGDLAEGFYHNRRKKTGSPAELKACLDFLEGFLEKRAFERMDPGRIITFRGNLCLLPGGIRSIDGLKLERAGLCLGSVRKDRFEPSHSLAMALSKDGVKRFYDIPAKDPAALSYLKGMTINITDERSETVPDGWCLVTIDGVSAGLGKKSGSIIKNHYPRGLRIV